MEQRKTETDFVSPQFYWCSSHAQYHILYLSLYLCGW